MKALCGFLLLAAACGPLPYRPTPQKGATCHDACRVLDALQCPGEGSLQHCVQSCLLAESEGIDVGKGCFAASQTCDQVFACEGPTTP